MKFDFSACFVTDGYGLRTQIENIRASYNPMCESYFNEILSKKNEAFCESACGFLLLDGLLLKNKINRAELIIAHDEKNRPLIIDDSIDFSISHSEGCAFCVVALAENGEKAEVGCDVQYAREYTPEKMDELAKAFMNEEELFAFRNAQDKAAEFFGSWTRRESFIKRAGLDLFGSFKTPNLTDGAFVGGVIRASGRNYYYNISLPYLPEDNADNAENNPEKQEEKQ